MHELKEFVDDSLKELPVGAQESWVLAHDVHDVGGDDGLVVLASFLLTQAQQILEHNHQDTHTHTHLSIYNEVHSRNTIRRHTQDRTKKADMNIILN